MKLPLHHHWKHFQINIKSSDQKYENQFIRRFIEGRRRGREFSGGYVELYEGTNPNNLKDNETDIPI